MRFCSCTGCSTSVSPRYRTHDCRDTSVTLPTNQQLYANATTINTPTSSATRRDTTPTAKPTSTTAAIEAHTCAVRDSTNVTRLRCE